jgi:DNA-binding LytR/AlgR family response regulator
MLDSLRRPVPGLLLLLGSVVTSVAVAFYCVAYTSLAGRGESAVEAFGWAIANVLPWLLSIEAGKRAANVMAAAVWLALAMLGSLVLGYLFAASAGDLGFEAVRRIPALAASAAGIALLRSGIDRQGRNGRELPLLPRQIDWVSAAGNYVELRAGARTIVHRSSIGAVESELAPHGFVRIHRSLLVSRERIAKVRPQDIILHDGTHLKIGKRYRTALAA